MKARGLKRKENSSERRARRMRARLRAVNRAGRARLSVHRTNKQIYAQVIDDVSGRTLAAASSLEAEVRDGADKEKGACGLARNVGAVLAARAREAGVGPVQFDRGSYLYHGRVKALAEGAREGGMDF